MVICLERGADLHMAQLMPLLLTVSAGTCASLHLAPTDNHDSTPPLSFFKDRMPFLPPNQQHQSTEGKL